MCIRDRFAGGRAGLLGFDGNLLGGFFGDTAAPAFTIPGGALLVAGVPFPPKTFVFFVTAGGAGGGATFAFTIPGGTLLIAGVAFAFPPKTLRGGGAVFFVLAGGGPLVAIRGGAGFDAAGGGGNPALRTYFIAP